MAKSNVATADEHLPTVAAAGTQVPAYLADRMAADAGKGISTAAEDNLVPLIYILQSNSPQVIPRNAEQIEGANAGDIWLRNGIAPIVDGLKGIWFQPCHFYKCVNEWIPRDNGGGFVGSHPQMPKDAVQRPDPKDETILRMYSADGNEYVDTRIHSGNVMLDSGVMLPYVMSLKGSGHSFSRSWMFQQGSRQVGGKNTPAFASAYHIRTKARKNIKGEWFTFEVVPGEVGVRWVSDAEYQRGLDLYNAIESGAKRAETPLADSVAEDDTADGEGRPII